MLGLPAVLACLIAEYGADVNDLASNHAAGAVGLTSTEAGNPLQILLEKDGGQLFTLYPHIGVALPGVAFQVFAGVEPALVDLW